MAVRRLGRCHPFHEPGIDPVPPRGPEWDDGDIWEGFQRGLAAILSFFYDLVPNYGVAIILLTIFINLMLFPLTLRQTRATRAFQSIQPEIRRMQKQYKDEPEKMQQELMRVQREAGATPGDASCRCSCRCRSGWRYSGCCATQLHFYPRPQRWRRTSRVPTFLGMDLAPARHRPSARAFYLSALPADPAGDGRQPIRPAVACPAQGSDPTGQPQQQTQQTITRILPLFIGFVSWNFPAGLVVYWTTGNLFRLGQQVVIFRMEGRPPPTKEAARHRRAGSGTR